MLWRCAWFLMLTCGLIAEGQAQANDVHAEKSKIIALENAWNQAQIHRDGEALNRLVADTFIYTDWDGTLLSKAQFISDSKDPSVETTLVANDDVQVYFYPGVAVVTGAYHARGKNKGKPFDHYGRFTDTWISLAGQWQCVASHTNLTRKPAGK
ncbi:MAG TPA: nuclear transport factor 2 family protein [Terriglobales bacterium]|nr:nuclear transport factor 2 family protein [Terriglobales bacterium]